MLIARPLAVVLLTLAASVALVVLAQSWATRDPDAPIVVDAITAPPDPCLVWVPGSEPGSLRAELAAACR